MKNQSQHIKGATRNITTICKSPLSLGQRKKDNDYSLSKNDRVNKKTTTIKTHIIQRSNIMKTNLANTFANRGMSLIILLVLFAAMAFGQGTFVISSGASFQPSTGTYTVKGNITNAAATSVTGIVTMAGTAAQTIGTSGNGTLTFPTLNINTTSATTTANVSTTVSGVLTIATGSTYDIGATTLTLGGTPATTGTLNVSNASRYCCIYWWFCSDNLGLDLRRCSNLIRCRCKKPFGTYKCCWYIYAFWWQFNS